MPGSKPSILIAEDNHVSSDLLRGILANFACHDIRCVRDGRAMVDAFKEQKAEVVFLDLNMPVLSGIEALKELRELDDSVFVVIVSGESSAENIQQSLKLGAQGFVVKPYSPSRIKDVLVKYQQSAK